MSSEEAVIAEAYQLITRRQAAKAIELLEAFVAKMPEGYRAFEEKEDEIVVGCWSLEEFLAVVADYEAKWRAGVGGPQKRITWRRSFFSQELYLLAVAYIESRDLRNAERVLEKGIQIDPVQPRFWCELGIVKMQQQDPEASAECYQKAVDVTPLTDPKTLAVARRGLGFAYIEQGRLDEALAEYEASLKLDPGNPTALHEVQYIRRLKEGGEPGRSTTLLR